MFTLRTLRMVAALGLLLAVCAGPAFTSPACYFTGHSMSCSSGCILIEWTYYADNPPFTPSVNVERKCCPDGNWETIASLVTTGSYLDCSTPTTCINGEAKWRITLNCRCVGSCSGCTGPICSIATDACQDCDDLPPSAP